MSTGYAEIFAWLLIALGAAVALGTGAALWQYHRTGVTPGRPDADAPVDTRGAVVKCVLGTLLVAGGVASLFAVRAG